VTVFHHHQHIDKDGRVLSAQCLDLPTRLPAPPGPEALAAAGRVYWQCLRAFGAPLLQIREAQDGGVAITAAGLTLLVFAPPLTVGSVALRYPIRHGWAVHPDHRCQGHLEMGVAPDAVTLTVAEYYPRLPGRIYALTQSPLHVHIARNYLQRLAREVAAWVPTS